MADNVILGAGRLFIKLAGESAERYVGDSQSATLSSQAERLTIPAGDGADAARTLVDRLVSVTYTLSLTLRHMSAENISLFLAGAVEDGASAKVTDESHHPDAGIEAAAAALKAAVGKAASLGDVRDLLLESDVGGGSAVFRLGPSPVGALAVMGIKAGSIDESASQPTAKDAAGSALTMVNLDAEGTTLASVRAAKALSLPSAALVAVLDKAAGKAAAADGKDLKVTYTPVKTKRVESGESDGQEGAVRYVEDPTVGLGRNLFVERATIGPAGEWALKNRQEPQGLPLQCVSTAKVYVDGRVA